MENFQIEPVSDVEAEGKSVSTVPETIPETFEQIMEQLDAFLNPPKLETKVVAVFPKIQKEEVSFYTRFPKFKLSSPLYRWVAATPKIAAHYEIKIPFVWSEYAIPRFGILAFTAKPSFYTNWEVEFAPWNSEGKSGLETINWTKLYYIDFFPPLRALERILLEAFQNETAPEAKVEKQLENQ